MKTRKAMMVAAVLGGMALSGAAIAGGRGQGGLGHGGGFHRLLEGVELTEAQTEMLEAARPDAEDREAMRAEHEAEREAILAELSKEKPDAARIHATIDARAAERTARMHEMVDAGLALYATLTPDQRAQVLENLAEGPPERGERSGGPGTRRLGEGERPEFER